MTTPNLPPQAYTKDILAQAFEWLKHQPSSVRELANSADSLVSLYLQSRRRDRSSANPLNIQPQGSPSARAFQSDLKSLAENLKQFDHEKDLPIDNTDNKLPPPSSISINFSSPETQPPRPSRPPVQLIETLDQRTRDTLREVQERFNLSNEQEALRLLVTLGYERVCEIFPRE